MVQSLHMLKQLNKFSKTKKYFVFDFDRTLAKMEIDWSEWHTGIATAFSQYDPNHGYELAKNPYKYHNSLVEKYGDPLLSEIHKFSSEKGLSELGIFDKMKSIVSKDDVE